MYYILTYDIITIVSMKTKTIFKGRLLHLDYGHYYMYYSFVNGSKIIKQYLYR